MWIFSSFQVPYSCSSSPGLRFAARCLHSPRSRRHRCCCSHWTRFFSSWRLSLLFCRRHLRSFCELSEKSALHWTPVTAWTLDTADCWLGSAAHLQPTCAAQPAAVTCLPLWPPAPEPWVSFQGETATTRQPAAPASLLVNFGMRFIRDIIVDDREILIYYLPTINHHPRDFEYYELFNALCDA